LLVRGLSGCLTSGKGSRREARPLLKREARQMRSGRANIFLQQVKMPGALPGINRGTQVVVALDLMLYYGFSCLSVFQGLAPEFCKNKSIVFILLYGLNPEYKIKKD